VVDGESSLAPSARPPPLPTQTEKKGKGHEGRIGRGGRKEEEEGEVGRKVTWGRKERSEKRSRVRGQQGRGENE